ncbi:hypothetical protein [Rhodoferax sp.]|uniref:CRISPR-associated protein Cas4 n=1 Tax=Rhodoferax sp. TaxID=50421 RepID=UPI00374D2312
MHSRIEPPMVELEQVPLSALQHWRYCPRQCGLVHLEQVFDENVYTLRGQALHPKVDQPGVAKFGLKLTAIQRPGEAMASSNSWQRSATRHHPEDMPDAV